MAPSTILTTADLPTVRPHRFGLQNSADAQQAARVGVGFGFEWMESCGDNVFVAPDNCAVPPLAPEDRVKTPFGHDLAGTADEFALYALFECSAIGSGLSMSERQRLANDELTLGEWYQIERRFKDVVQAAAPFAVGGIAGARNALAVALSKWKSPVEPIVHMTPNVAVALGSTIQNKTSHIELRTGERVAVGYGYSDEITDDTEGWIALTGPVVVRYGTSINSEPALSRDDNTVLALAERPYAIGHLCKAIHVTVNDVVTNTA